VVLTRPAGRNEGLAQKLALVGLPSLVMPALEIQAIAVANPPGPEAFDLVVFVSGQAVQSYMQVWLRSPEACWPARTLAACVGPSTARALFACGVCAPPDVVYPAAGSGNDSEALWRVLQPRLSGVHRALLVRGAGGRDWLARQLVAAGVDAHSLELYRRLPVRPSQSQLEACARELQRPCRPAIVLVTSTQSLDAMADQMHQAGLLEPWLRSRFLAIHPRIAEQLHSVYSAAGMAGAPMVKLCSPNDDAIYQAIVAMASFPECS
jgi:uroporphyrinogen-III synthase